MNIIEESKIRILLKSAVLTDKAPILKAQSPTGFKASRYRYVLPVIPLIDELIYISQMRLTNVRIIVASYVHIHYWCFITWNMLNQNVQICTWSVLSTTIPEKINVPSIVHRKL